MERDEIIRSTICREKLVALAREAGMAMGFTQGIAVMNHENLERFAAIVAKHWIETNKALAKEIIELKKQAEQEPVAWYSVKGGFNTCGEGKPLYAAPVRTKDLTDDELAKAAGFHELLPQELYIARAVIAADRELNK